MMPEKLAGLGRFLRIERFDRAAKLGQIGADPRVLVDRLDRPVEEAVGCAGRLGDFLAAHRRQLIDLLAEFRAVGVERRQLVDELVDAPVELGRLLGLERDKPGRFRRRDRVQRLGRVELELRRGRGLGGGFRGHRPSSSLSPGSHGERLPPRASGLLYYRNNTALFKRRCERQDYAGVNRTLNLSHT